MPAENQAEFFIQPDGDFGFFAHQVNFLYIYIAVAARDLFPPCLFRQFERVSFQTEHLQ